MKPISGRQLMIFYCIWSFAIKFLMLPQLLSASAGRDAWISALIGTVFEVCILFVVLNVMVIGRDSNIYSDSRRNAHRIVAKAAIFCMLVLFLLQIFILNQQAYHLLNDNMFENLSSATFLIPMLVLGVFFCFLPSRAIFRSGEIFYVFIIIGIALSVFPALGHINPGEVLPVFDKGAGPAFNGIYKNLIYFESASFLLMFSGEVQIGKHFRKKFMTLAIILGAFFVFFVFMFYSLFGPLAPTKNIAIANLTLYSSYLTQSGRLDWVLVTIWLLLLLIRFGVTFFCCFAAIRYLTNLKNRAAFIALPLAVFIYLINTFVFASASTLNNFIAVIPWLVAVLYIAIPIFFLVNALINHKRRGA